MSSITFRGDVVRERYRLYGRVKREREMTVRAILLQNILNAILLLFLCHCFQLVFNGQKRTDTANGDVFSNGFYCCRT